MPKLIILALLTASSVCLAENIMDKKLVGKKCGGKDWQLVINAADSSVAAQSNPSQIIETLKAILAAEMTTRCNLVMDSAIGIGIPEDEIHQFLIASSQRSYLVQVNLAKLAGDRITHVFITRVK